MSDILQEKEILPVSSLSVPNEKIDKAEKDIGDMKEELNFLFVRDQEFFVKAGKPVTPTGGTEGQVLRKKSVDDFDLEWVDLEIPKLTEYLPPIGFVYTQYGSEQTPSDLFGSGVWKTIFTYSMNVYNQTEKNLEHIDESVKLILVRIWKRIE